MENTTERDLCSLSDLSLKKEKKSNLSLTSYQSTLLGASQGIEHLDLAEIYTVEDELTKVNEDSWFIKLGVIQISTPE